MFMLQMTQLAQAVVKVLKTEVCRHLIPVWHSVEEHYFAKFACLLPSHAGV